MCLFLLSKKMGGALGLLPNLGQMLFPFILETADLNNHEAGFGSSVHWAPVQEPNGPGWGEGSPTYTLHAFSSVTETL